MQLYQMQVSSNVSISIAIISTMLFSLILLVVRYEKKHIQWEGNTHFN